MKQSRFTETQIIGILKEADSGIAVNEIWRKHGISSAESSSANQETLDQANAAIECAAMAQ